MAGPDDWARWRALRLEALEDTPIGFLETPSLHDHRVFVGAVYITPRWHGRRHAELARLVDAVAGWAVSSTGRLLLEVHETNLRARAAYARLGFVETGATAPYPWSRVG